MKKAKEHTIHTFLLNSDKENFFNSEIFLNN